MVINGYVQVGEVEEAAERRQRNLQRRQNQMETEVTWASRSQIYDDGFQVADSPGLERQGSSTNRRSVGGISGLSHAQVRMKQYFELISFFLKYATCIMRMRCH